MKPQQENIASELRRIEAKRGILRPSDVVAAARKETSILHKCFEWDDSKAAHEHRLLQARKLIQVMVTVLPTPGGDTEQRIWVNLRNDSESEGYRQLSVVLSNKGMRESLLRQSMADMDYFSKKYSSLVELADVFRSMRKAKVMLGAKK